jgi:hypothetical protein
MIYTALASMIAIAIAPTST